MRWKTACQGDAETFVSRGGWRVKPFVRTIWSNAASLCMCVLWDEHVQTEHGFDAMHGLSPLGRQILNGSQDFYRRCRVPSSYMYLDFFFTP